MRRLTRTWRLCTALVVGAVLATPATAADNPYPYPFRNPDLSLNTRIDDLLGRLTLDEKISLLHQYAPAIPRLGIGMFKTGTGRCTASPGRPTSTTTVPW
jgi:beta-glucosidase